MERDALRPWADDLWEMYLALPGRARAFLDPYFGLDDGVEEMTLKELGKRMGMSVQSTRYHVDRWARVLILAIHPREKSPDSYAQELQEALWIGKMRALRATSSDQVAGTG